MLERCFFLLGIFEVFFFGGSVNHLRGHHFMPKFGTDEGGGEEKRPPSSHCWLWLVSYSSSSSLFMSLRTEECLSRVTSLLPPLPSLSLPGPIGECVRVGTQRPICYYTPTYPKNGGRGEEEEEETEEEEE